MGKASFRQVVGGSHATWDFLGICNTLKITWKLIQNQCKSKEEVGGKKSLGKWDARMSVK